LCAGDYLIIHGTARWNVASAPCSASWWFNFAGSAHLARTIERVDGGGAYSIWPRPQKKKHIGNGTGTASAVIDAGRSAVVAE